jgi:hypothetical protein
MRDSHWRERSLRAVSDTYTWQKNVQPRGSAAPPPRMAHAACAGTLTVFASVSFFISGCLNASVYVSVSTFLSLCLSEFVVFSDLFFSLFFFFFYSNSLSSQDVFRRLTLLFSSSVMPFQMWIIGGYDGESELNDVWAFDTKARVWTEKKVTLTFLKDRDRDRDRGQSQRWRRIG